jgi:hypothetical protein
VRRCEACSTFAPGVGRRVARGHVACHAASCRAGMLPYRTTAKASAHDRGISRRSRYGAGAHTGCTCAV